MIYLFPPVFCIVMMLVLAALLVWAVIRKVGEVLSSPPGSSPRLDPVGIRNRKSTGGKCHVTNDGYYAPMKKYVAEVVCEEMDSRRMLVADSLAELEEKIVREFDYCEGRIQDAAGRKAAG